MLQLHPEKPTPPPLRPWQHSVFARRRCRGGGLSGAREELWARGRARGGGDLGRGRGSRGRGGPPAPGSGRGQAGTGAGAGRGSEQLRRAAAGVRGAAAPKRRHGAGQQQPRRRRRDERPGGWPGPGGGGRRGPLHHPAGPQVLSPRAPPLSEPHPPRPRGWALLPRRALPPEPLPSPAGLAGLPSARPPWTAPCGITPPPRY